MPGRVRELGRVAGFGRVERPGQARAGLRGDAGPVVFEKDPGSVTCPRFIPPTTIIIKFASFGIKIMNMCITTINIQQK